MDGHRPPNINGSKNIIPGVPTGSNVFLPSSLFAQPQIPTSSTCPTNTANLPWAKNQVFQNWVDQTKNMPNMYNMFAAGNMANGSFASNLDNSWQNPSTSQSNLNLSNPLLAAFQQQSLNYAGGKNANNSAAPLNPLINSTSNTRQPSAPSFDPLSLHPTPSALNPPIPQPKQPPKHSITAESLFPALPTTSAYMPPTSLPSSSNYGTAAAASAKLADPFAGGYSYDQLRDHISAMAAQQQPFGQPQQQVQQRPIARPQPRPSATAAAPGIPPQTFDLLSSVSAGMKDIAKATPAASGFSLSQILPPSTATMMPPALQSPPQTTSSSMPGIFPHQMPSTSTAMPNYPSQMASSSTHNLSQPSTSGMNAPAFSLTSPASSTATSSAPSLQIPSTSSLTVPSSDGTLISPRTGQPKRRSGGQNGELARPPSEGGLDLDLDDGFDLFDGMGMTQGEQAWILVDVLQSLNLDFLGDAFTIPTSNADEPPKPVEKPKVEEPKKEEVSSAMSKMERLMAQLKKSRSGAAPAAGAVAPKAATPAPLAAAAPTAIPTPPAATATPPVVFQKPATPVEKTDKPTFTPPLSPVDLSDPSKPSTSGISSLIAASILPSELRMGKPSASDMKKNIPIYLRPQPEQSSSSIQIYKQKEPKSYLDSKDDEFAFTDEDPEETGEKFKRDDESEDEPEKAAQEGKTGDKDTGMGPKYVSKIGFDVKEGEKEQKKESKKPVPIFPGRDRHARQESLEFAERLRKRRKEIVNVGFANVQQCEHNQCAIDSIQKNVEDADKPPLPRLLIRLPKKSIGGEEKSRRRKKKRRYYEEGEEESEEDSDDWYGGRPKKRRGRKPKRELHPDETYSVRLVDPSTIEHARKEVHVRPMEYMSKKEKFLRNWREENAGQDEPPAATGRGVKGKIEPKSLTKIVTEYKNAEARERLERFKHCTGATQRHTFLVLKSEINTPDCSLWRVDNMNLLQKFPGFMGRTEPKGPLKLLYKNSSTYSGWCEQLQSGYLEISVKIVKQTRSDCVVEPYVPVDELFPAISEEINERYCVPAMKALVNKEDVAAQTEARNFILKDDVRNGLYMVIRNMLDGALTFDYFSRAEHPMVGSLSNPSFELLNEMECQVRECEEEIRDRVSFGTAFETSLRRYSACLFIDCELSELDCQACGEAPVEKTLQLFDLTVESEKKDENDFCDDQTAYLPAVDFLVCAGCSKLAMWQHRLIHFRQDLARRIEDRLLESTLEMPSLVPEQILDNLRQYYTWMREVIVAHTDTWDAIMKSDESEDPEEESMPTSSAAAAAEDAPAAAVATPVTAKFEEAAPAAKVEAVDPAPAAAVAPAPAAFPIQVFAAALAAAAAPKSEGVDDDDDDLIDPVTL